MTKSTIMSSPVGVIGDELFIDVRRCLWTRGGPQSDTDTEESASIEWADPEVESLRSSAEELRKELKNIKMEMNNLRAQLRARKFIRPSVVYLRPKN